MKSFSVLTFLFIAIQFIACSEICYDGYGCFTDEYPFGGSMARPFSLLPEKPSKINTRFTLFNRNLKNTGDFITFQNLSSSFIPSLPTKFIVHGFYDTPNNQIKKNLIEYDDCNVITVNWSDGSKFPYTQATANTQVVGVEIYKLVQSIIDATGVSAKSFHLIGHSLGAHVCGYAGKKIYGLGRITGLDPAGPYFENTPEIVRLHVNDADFVDVIHTNAKKLVSGTPSIGMYPSIGHVDFYPNGGEIQPGCWVTDGNFDPTCSHMASMNLFSDSIKNSCQYTAYACNSTGDFYKGSCLKCSSKKCNRMGYWASSDRELGSLYLNTQSIFSKNKCKQNYQITLISGKNGSKQAKGKFSAYFVTENDPSSTFVLDNSNTVFKSNQVVRKLVSLSKPLENSQIISVFIKYVRGWNVISYENKWIFENVEVFSADRQELIKLCPTETLTRGYTEYTTCQ